MAKYNTKQKDLIINIIKEQKHDFTIKDIYNKLNKKVGLTTIYRLVDIMIKDNLLTKITKDNNTYYQYLEHCSNTNHFYLRCEICGNLIHIDCDCINSLTEHIYKTHKFKPNKDHIIINGLCHKCKEVE